MTRIVFVALALLPSARTTAASLSPGAYVAHLEVPAADLRGAALIDDPAAQDWLRVHRPEQFPALYAEALNRADVRETLTTFTDPSSLREAIIAHDVPSLVAEPDGLLDILATDPDLAGHRPAIEMAALSWAGLSTETREVLTREGIAESAWTGKSLPDRISSLRGAYEARIFPEVVTAPSGTVEHVRQYERYLRRLAKVIGEGQLSVEIGRWKALNQLAAGLKNDGSSIPRGEVREPTLGMGAFEQSLLLKKLSKAMLLELKETRIGFRQTRRLQEGPVHLAITELPGAVMQISHRLNRLEISDKSLSSVIAALGWTPRALLIEDAAVREVAVAMAHAFLHESIHSEQNSWLERFRPAHSQDNFYSLESEHEAFLAQAVFLGQRMQDEPAYQSVIERLSNSPFTAAWTLGEIMGNIPRFAAAGPAAFNDYWLPFYTYLPTLSRAGSRAIMGALGRSAVEGTATVDFVGKIRERYQEAIAALWTEFRSLDFLPERDGPPPPQS